MFRDLLRKAPKAWYRLSLAAFYFLQGLIFASWASRIPDIQAALGMSKAVLGTMLFFPPAGQLATMALAGWAVGRFGSRKVILFAVSFYPLALISLGLATSTTQLACGLLLFGIFANLANIAINAQAIGVERLYRGRSIMASFHGLWSLAGLTGGLFGMLFVALDVPPVAHFCFIYAVGIVLVLSMARTMLPRDRKIVRKKIEPKSGGERRRILPDRYLLILGLVAFGAMACEGTMFDWSNVYFKEVIQPPKALSRLGYVAAMFCMMCGRFAADRLIAKFGVVNILTVSGVTIAAGLFTATLFPYLPTATLGFMLVGLGVSSVVPIAYSLSGRSTTLPPGAAVAVVSTVGLMGFLLGPPVIGFLAEATSLRVSLGLVGFVGLAISLFAHVISREIERPKICKQPLPTADLRAGG